jgi:hypothetical protein
MEIWKVEGLLDDPTLKEWSRYVLQKYLDSLYNDELNKIARLR